MSILMKYSLLVLILASSLIYSQPDSPNSFTLPELKISQFEAGKIITYEFKSERNKFNLYKNYLMGDTALYRYKISTDSILKITFIKSKYVLPVAVASFGAGFVFGYFSTGFGSSDYSTTDGKRYVNGLLTGLVTGIAGGCIALLLNHDEEYLLTGSTDARYKQLLKYMNENKIK